MKKIKIIYIIISILVLAILIAGYFYLNNHNNTKNPTTTTTSDIDKKVDLSPATPEDKKNNDANKEKIVARDETIKSNTTSNKVVPIITYAGQYEKNIEVGGYVNLYEKDGTFTATFTQGDQKIIRTVAGNPNVQTTDCPRISVSVTDFPAKGTWNLTLSYKSSTSSGDSTISNIEVK